VRNKVFAELMAVGLLLPLLLMWLLNWLTAKFEPPSKVKYAVVKAMVSKDGTVNRSDAKAVGLGVRADDFRALDLEGRKRSFDAGPLHFQSRTRLSPFAAPTGEVSAAGFAVGTLPPLALGRSADRSTVPFGLAGCAVVLVPQPALMAEGDKRPDVEVTLVLFAPAAELSQYTTHFDGHRDTVKSIVTALWERSRADVERRKQDADEQMAADNRPKRSGRAKPGTDQAQLSSGGPPGRSSAPASSTGNVDGPPPRRSAAGDGRPPPRHDPAAGSPTGPPGRRATPANGGGPAPPHHPSAVPPTGPPPRRTDGNGSNGPPGRSGANGDPARPPTTPLPTSDDRSEDPAPPPRRGSY
jgi:hypothetical protein